MKRPSSINLPNAKPGRCRYCKCTDACACDEGCSWYDAEHTVCDSQPCMIRFILARIRKAESLLHIGLKKQKLKALSCYSESCVIVIALRKELTGVLEKL